MASVELYMREIINRFDSVNNNVVEMVACDQDQFSISNSDWRFTTFADWRIHGSEGLVVSSKSNQLDGVVDLLINKQISEVSICENRTPIDLTFETSNHLTIEVFSNMLYEPWEMFIGILYDSFGRLDSNSMIDYYRENSVKIASDILAYSYDEALTLSFKDSSIEISSPWRIVGKNGLIFGCYDQEDGNSNLSCLLKSKAIGYLYNKKNVMKDFVILFDNYTALEVFDVGYSKHDLLLNQIESL